MKREDFMVVIAASPLPTTYFLSPEMLTAIGTVLLFAATLVLAWVTYKNIEELKETTGVQADAMCRQADAMSQQAAFMAENAKREQLERKYERLQKEKLNLVGKLFSRMDDGHIFTPRRLHDKTDLLIDSKMDPLAWERAVEFDAFWKDIKENMYLDQSGEIISALNDYKATVNSYLMAMQNTSQGICDDQEKTKQMEKHQSDFGDRRQKLFDAIEKRNSEIQKELIEIDREQISPCCATLTGT